MRNPSLFVALTAVLQYLCIGAGVDAAKVKRVKAGKNYNEHDPVHIVVNKVGPFNNPMETYRYYSLPFCQSHSSAEVEAQVAEEEAGTSMTHRLAETTKREGGIRHKQRMGESIVGDRRETSPYEISFMDSVDWRLLCQEELDAEDLTKFKEAIHNNYFFEMFVEDLPMWGYIGDAIDEDIILGESDSSRTFLFPHLHFVLGYNQKRIVSAKVTTDMDRRVDITDVNVPKTVSFSYSVEWVEDDLPWKNRMSRYADSRFLPGSFEIHWLSIINSFVLVLLLTAFLTIILLRVLKNDFSRYMELDDDALEEEESGWKLIHGDVFRFPEHVTIFCSAVGVGNQLIVLTLCHLCLALTNIISTTRRGSIMAGVVILYCLTSYIGGYSSIKLYRQMGGKDWVRCTLTTAGLFPVPTAVVFLWVNTVALFHGATSALPFTAILTVTALFLFVSLPLTLFGAIMAKNNANPDFNAPTRTTKVAREIPSEVAWYRGQTFQVLVAGFLPFSAIYIELHYIFASMWGHQIYSLFGILLIAFCLLGQSHPSLRSRSCTFSLHEKIIAGGGRRTLTEE